MTKKTKWQQEARNAFRQKIPASQDGISPSLYTFAFTVAGVQEEELLAKLHDLIQKRIDAGEDYAADNFDAFIDDTLKQVKRFSCEESPLTPARLKLIYQTNVRQAYGLAQWRMGIDAWHLSRFPCWRFVRTPGARIKRVAHTYTENWVRLKTDWDFWAKKMNARSLGGFEVPYAPFGFNSYMVLEPVSRTDALAAGISEDKINQQSKKNMKRSKFRDLLPEDWQASHRKVSRGKSTGSKKKLQSKLANMARAYSKKSNSKAKIAVVGENVKITY